MSKHYCWKCKVNEIPEPEYCCSGLPNQCGCMGLPIDPPYCEECYKEETDGDKK